MSEMEMNETEFFKAGKENPFTLPNGYFESLPSRIQNYCQAEDKKVENYSWVYAFRTQLSLIGGFLVLVFIGYTGFYFGSRLNQYNLQSDPDYVRIVEKHVSEFDEIELYNAIFNEKDTKKDTLTKKYDEEFMHYILRENLDNVTLIDHSKDIKP